MTDFVFIACPYCSHSLVLERFKKTAFPISPVEFLIYSKRAQKSEKGFHRGDGRGHRGFFKVENSGKTIIGLMNGSAEEKLIVERIAERVKAIYNSYVQAGLIQQ